MRTVTDQTWTCDVDASYPPSRAQLPVAAISKAAMSDTSTRITRFAE
jgi:hypothetical protein